MQSVEDLFLEQRLFDAHHAMQAELSSEGRIQHDTKSEIFGNIRSEYRRVSPLYNALTCKKAWNGNDDILLGQSEISRGIWRVRSELEIPPKDLVGVLMQPALWVPLLLPGALVSVVQNDAFKADVSVVIPSAIFRALDVKYQFTQTLYRTDKAVLIYLEDDAVQNTGARFGRHLFLVKQDAPEEAVLEYIVEEKQSCLVFSSYVPKMQEYAAYMLLGRFLAKLRQTSAQFFMCDATLQHFKAAFQRKTTVLRWLDAVFGA